jgi:hypothetical protein
MKTLLGAIALTLAVPTFAQAAPAADPHAQHQGMDHSQHQAGKHDCKACCEKMKGKDGKMECMEKKGEADAAKSGHAGHEGHSGH